MIVIRTIENQRIATDRQLDGQCFPLTRTLENNGDKSVRFAAKHLGVHVHVCQQKTTNNRKNAQDLVGRHSSLSTGNRRLLYTAVIEPTRTFNIRLSENNSHGLPIRAEKRSISAGKRGKRSAQKRETSLEGPSQLYPITGREIRRPKPYDLVS